MIELIVTACLLARPDDCAELHLPTGFTDVEWCEENGLILVAAMMMQYPEREAMHYRCERVGPLPFEGHAWRN